MIFLKQNPQKETINILLSENRRLKRENHLLRESLQETQKYKEEYKELIDRLNGVKSSYGKKLEEFDSLKEQYKKELEKLFRQNKQKRK